MKQPYIVAVDDDVSVLARRGARPQTKFSSNYRKQTPATAGRLRQPICSSRGCAERAEPLLPQQFRHRLAGLVVERVGDRDGPSDRAHDSLRQSIPRSL